MYIEKKKMDDKSPSPNFDFLEAYPLSDFIENFELLIDSFKFLLSSLGNVSYYSSVQTFSERILEIFNALNATQFPMETALTENDSKSVSIKTENLEVSDSTNTTSIYEKESKTSPNSTCSLGTETTTPSSSSSSFSPSNDLDDNQKRSTNSIDNEQELKRVKT